MEKRTVNIISSFEGKFKNIKDINKKRIIFLSVFIVVLNSMIMPMIFEGDSFSKVVIMGGIFTLPLVVLINCNEINCFNTKSRKYYMMLFVVGASFIFNSIVYKVIGYLAIGLIFCFVIPIINYIVFKTEVNVIYVATKSICIFFIIFMIASLIIGPPLNYGQYSAIVGNPNRLAELIIIVVPSCLIQIKYYFEIKNKRYIFFLIELSLVVSVCLFTNSRIAFISTLVQIVFFVYYLFFYNKYQKNISLKIILKVVVCALLVLFITFIATFYAFTAVKVYMIEKFPKAQMSLQYDELSYNDMFCIVGNRYTRGIGENNNDEFTSGRISIWRNFAKDVGLLGHADEGISVEEGGRSYAKTTAHNVYLQIAYSSGITAGIVMLIFMASIALNIICKCINIAKGENIDSNTCFSILIALGFGLESMTASCYMMYTYLPATFFYCTICYLVANRGDGR